MTVRVNKDSFNLREKLSELERPSVDKLVTRTDSGVYIDKLGGVTNLAEINSGIVTPMNSGTSDVFVYDTSKDSDGGAWRKRTQHTSWYKETLNTDERGSRREFPAVAVIVTQQQRVTIYDGDDPDLPMWMVFKNGRTPIATLNWYSSSVITGIKQSCALNGTMVVNPGNGLVIYNFISDDIRLAYGTTAYNLWPRTIDIRNNYISANVGGDGYILNTTIVNDIDITVVPNSPTDEKTGIQKPTIGCATENGVSIIKDDDSVVDINSDGSVGPGTDGIGFYNSSQFITAWDTVGSGTRNTYSYDIPNADINASSYLARYVDATTGSNAFLYYGTSGSRADRVYPLKGHYRNRFAFRGTFTGDALCLIDEDQRSSGGTNGMVAFIRPDFTTGWLHGRNKCVYFSSTTIGSITSQEDDHSPNAKHLTINGTLERKTVNANTELVGYYGFSSSNYLSHTNFFAPGSGNFAVTFWIKPNTLNSGNGNYMQLFSIGTSATGGQGRSTGFTVKMTTTAGTQPAGYSPYFYNGDGGQNHGTYNVDNYFPIGTWSHCVAMRRDGRAYMFIDGKLVQTGNTWTTNLTDTYLTIGRAFGYNEFGGDAEIALLRYEVGTAPQNDQVMAMYEDEKHLFKQNAKCTLHGSSLDIIDCCYDNKTDILHVGTPDGRSDFRSLERINNTNTAVSNSISAYDGFIVEV